MPDSPPLPSPDEAVEAAAAQWLARRDRGLSAREQADYAAWLQADLRHEATVGRLERTWDALDRLAVDPAFQAQPPDPDLLAPRRRGRWLWIFAPLLAAAAAVALVYFGRAPGAHAPAAPQAIVHPGPERLNLEDGSVVELNTGAKVEVTFTPAERRIRLVRGEAYFTVAKNPARPFIVSANQVAVRAVGTAFSVGLAPRGISVLVTEGHVRVDEVLPPAGEKSATLRALSALGPGQQGVVSYAAPAPDAPPAVMTVTELSPAEVEQALFWRGLRLEFAGLPLGEVVAEFNRYNRKKLVVHDAATAAIRVGGNFRADNVDAFIRLLDVGFGVSAFPAGGEIILRKTHGP
jgi:transmembrane sensor